VSNQKYTTPRKTDNNLKSLIPKKIKLNNKKKGKDMSKKRTVYSAAFKTKLVLELLKEDKTLTQIASENNITPKNIQN